LVLDIRTPILKRLYSDWKDSCRGRPLPSRSDFDVLEFRYVVGKLSLVDVTYNPLRFRFRLHATGVAQRVGYELTGKDLDELPAPAAREIARQHFVAVVEQRTPIVQMRERQVVDASLKQCEVLMLPLSRDGEAVDMIMSAIVWL
jgi:hypothetical protein